MKTILVATIIAAAAYSAWLASVGDELAQEAQLTIYPAQPGESPRVTALREHLARERHRLLSQKEIEE